MFHVLWLKLTCNKNAKTRVWLRLKHEWKYLNIYHKKIAEQDLKEWLLHTMQSNWRTPCFHLAQKASAMIPRREQAMKIKSFPGSQRTRLQLNSYCINLAEKFPINRDLISVSCSFSPLQSLHSLHSIFHFLSRGELSIQDLKCVLFKHNYHVNTKENMPTQKLHYQSTVINSNKAYYWSNYHSVTNSNELIPYKE